MQDKNWEVVRAGEPREPTRFPVFVLHRDLGSRLWGMAGGINTPPVNT